MRPRHPAFLAAVVLAVTFAIVAVQVKRSRSEIDAQLAKATEQRVRLRAELHRTTRLNPASTTKGAVAVPNESPKYAAPASAFPPRTRPPGLLDFARNNPQLWNEFIQSKRVELGRLHLPILQRLNLTPAQQERFKDILAAAIARGSDIGSAADAQGLSQSDPAILSLREQSEKQRKAELADLLGPVVFREFEDYERALPVRGFVDGFAVQVAFSVPLSEQQANQLERALAQANESYRAGKAADPKAVDWDVVDAHASEILTPEQFAAWKLGLAHNKFGGSRRSQELQKVYEQALARMKRTGSQ